MSSKYIENIIKFKFTANNINSIDIIITNIFLLFRTKPMTPITNNAAIKHNMKFKFKDISNIILNLEDI